MMITQEATERGFRIDRFVDQRGVNCSLQKSSVAGETCVWLGCDEIGLMRFDPDFGWIELDVENDRPGVSYTANTRMHLTQAQVAQLLPALQHFVETGELPLEADNG